MPRPNANQYGQYPLDPGVALNLASLFRKESGLPSKILDPFANTGNTLQCFADQLSAEAYAIELDEGFGRELQERFSAGRAIIGDAWELASPNKSWISQDSFGLIVSNPPFNGSGNGIRSGRLSFETRALLNLMRFLVPGGWLVHIMYAHNINMKMIGGMIRYSSNSGLGWNHTPVLLDDNHLESGYKLIAFFVQRGVEAVNFEEDDLNVAANLHEQAALPGVTIDIGKINSKYTQKAFACLEACLGDGKMVTLDQLVDKGVYYNVPGFKGGRFKFESNKPDIQADSKAVTEQLGSSSDGLLDKMIGEFTLDQTVRSVIPVRHAHIGPLATGGTLDNVLLYDPDSGQLLAIKAQTVRKERVVGENQRVDKNGNIVDEEIAYVEPHSIIYVLREDGSSEEIDDPEEINAFIEKHVDDLSRAFRARVDPMFDMRVDPISSMVLDNIRVNKYHPDVVKQRKEAIEKGEVDTVNALFPTQEFFAVATAKSQLLGYGAIGNAEPSFGKTISTTSAFVLMHVYKYVAQNYPEFFKWAMRQPHQTVNEELASNKPIHTEEEIKKMMTSLKKYNPQLPNIVVAPGTMPLGWLNEQYFSFKEPETYVIPSPIDEYRNIKIVIPRVIPMLLGSVYESISSDSSAMTIKLYERAQQLGSEDTILFGIASYEWMKLKHGWTAAVHEKRQAKTEIDYTGDSPKKVVKQKPVLARCAVTNVPPGDSMIKKEVAFRHPMFAAGREFTGYEWEEDSRGDMYRRETYRIVRKHHGYALWQECRMFGLPEKIENENGLNGIVYPKGNGLVDYTAMTYDVKPANGEYGIIPDYFSQRYSGRYRESTWTPPNELAVSRSKCARTRIQVTETKYFKRPHYFVDGDPNRIAFKSIARQTTKRAWEDSPDPKKYKRDVTEYKYPFIINKKDESSKFIVRYKMNGGFRVYEPDPMFNELESEVHEIDGSGLKYYKRSNGKIMVKEVTDPENAFIGNYKPNHEDAWIMMNGVRPTWKDPITTMLNKMLRDYQNSKPGKRVRKVDGITYRVGDGDVKLDTTLILLGLDSYTGVGEIPEVPRNPRRSISDTIKWIQNRKLYGYSKSHNKL